MRDQQETVGLAIVNSALIIVYIAVIMPFLTMFVWNTLVSGLFGVMTIGYGGAWAVVVIRSFFFKSAKEPQERTPEESLGLTMQSYLYAVLAAVFTLIIGLSLGYL